jgi:hypothetical protein
MEKIKERNRCYSIRVQTNPVRYSGKKKTRNATETRK